MFNSLMSKLLFLGFWLSISLLFFWMGNKATASTQENIDYQYFDKVEELSYEFNVDPYLISAIIKQESNWNPLQAGGGLMQVSWDLENTIYIQSIDRKGELITHSIGPDIERFNIHNNIKYGVMKINNLLREFDGDTNKAIQAYNFNVSGFMKEFYPTEWENGEWLHYREEARQYYAMKEKGWNNSRSASTYCFSKNKEVDYDQPLYGDTCYVENVTRYYDDKKYEKMKIEKIKENLSNSFLLKQLNIKM